MWFGIFASYSISGIKPIHLNKDNVNTVSTTFDDRQFLAYSRSIKCEVPLNCHFSRVPLSLPVIKPIKMPYIG